jgi:hypothetical protein
VLGSNSTAATVPSTATVPAGATSITFTITAGYPGSNQTAVITASYAGTTAQANLAVTGSGGSKCRRSLKSNHRSILNKHRGEHKQFGRYSDSQRRASVSRPPAGCEDGKCYSPLLYRLNYHLGHTITLKLAQQGQSTSGTVTGTFSLTTSFATVTGTITETYSGF